MHQILHLFGILLAPGEELPGRLSRRLAAACNRGHPRSAPGRSAGTPHEANAPPWRQKIRFSGVSQNEEVVTRQMHPKRAPSLCERRAEIDLRALACPYRV